MAASLALLLGAFAGFGMARFARFRGRLVFGFALLAPWLISVVVPVIVSYRYTLAVLPPESGSIVPWTRSEALLR